MKKKCESKRENDKKTTAIQSIDVRAAYLRCYFIFWTYVCLYLGSHLYFHTSTTQHNTPSHNYQLPVIFSSPLRVQFCALFVQRAIISNAHKTAQNLFSKSIKSIFPDSCFLALWRYIMQIWHGVN